MHLCLAGDRARPLALERSWLVSGDRGKGYSFGEVATGYCFTWPSSDLGWSAAGLGFFSCSDLPFCRGETRSEAERAFLAVTAASIPWIVVEVAVFASRFSLRVEERYMFFLAPLLFLAFALWLDRGVPRPPVLAAAAAAIPVALLFTLPLGSLLNVSISRIPSG